MTKQVDKSAERMQATLAAQPQTVDSGPFHSPKVVCPYKPGTIRIEYLAPVGPSEDVRRVYEGHVQGPIDALGKIYSRSVNVSAASIWPVHVLAWMQEGLNTEAGKTVRLPLVDGGEYIVTVKPEGEGSCG